MNSFPPPRPDDRAASSLSAAEGKAFNIGPSIQKYHGLDENGKLVITHHSSTLPPHDSSGRMNLTSPPPANWPTASQRIRAKMRGGSGSGRGDNPHGGLSY